MGASAAAPGVARTRNPAAYDAVLRGRYFMNQRTGEGIRKGIKQFERAVAWE